MALKGWNPFSFDFSKKPKDNPQQVKDKGDSLEESVQETHANVFDGVNKTGSSLFDKTVEAANVPLKKEADYHYGVTPIRPAKATSKNRRTFAKNQPDDSVSKTQDSDFGD